MGAFLRSLTLDNSPHPPNRHSLLDPLLADGAHDVKLFLEDEPLGDHDLLLHHRDDEDVSLSADLRERPDLPIDGNPLDGDFLRADERSQHLVVHIHVGLDPHAIAISKLLFDE